VQVPRRLGGHPKESPKEDISTHQAMGRMLQKLAAQIPQQII
jgi:hypothetical protein